MRAISLVAFAALLQIHCLSIGRVPEMPEGKEERALMRDLTLIVSSGQQLGWTLDDVEVQAAMTNTMMSVCANSDATLATLTAWLAERNRGVDLKREYEAHGESMDAIQEKVIHYRSALLLTEAMKLRAAGKCPFWIKPKGDFKGIQDDNGKFYFSFETGGRFFFRSETRDTMGAGGIMRFMLGRGLSHRVSLRTGLEFSFTAQFADPSTEKPPALIFSTAAPLAVQYRFLSEYLEYELGPLAILDKSKNVVQWGIHTGVGLGISRIRVRNLMPGIIFTVNYQFVPAQQGYQAAHQVSLGARAVLSFGM